MLLCPCLVVFIWISLSSFNGSLTVMFNFISNYGWRSFALYAPQPSSKAALGYTAWVLFQAGLYQFLPSQLSTGQLTPAGNLLQYRTNGLLAWVVTHALFGGLVLFGNLDPAIIARNWEGLLVAANVAGFALSLVAYAKAHVSPTHGGDRKFSGEVTSQHQAKKF
jgi:7-dehydrocholesterol reductase